MTARAMSGDRERYLAEGMVNLPINDRTAVRLVGWHRHDAGYIDNVYRERTFPTSGVTVGKVEQIEFRGVGDVLVTVGVGDLITPTSDATATIVSVSLVALLAFLIIWSAFFAMAETALMSANKYRLRALAKRKLDALDPSYRD